MWPLKKSWPQCRPPKFSHLSRSKVPRGIVARPIAGVMSCYSAHVFKASTYLVKIVLITSSDTVQQE